MTCMTKQNFYFLEEFNSSLISLVVDIPLYYSDTSHLLWFYSCPGHTNSWLKLVLARKTHRRYLHIMFISFSLFFTMYFFFFYLDRFLRILHVRHLQQYLLIGCSILILLNKVLYVLTLNHIYCPLHGWLILLLYFCSTLVIKYQIIPTDLSHFYLYTNLPSMILILWNSLQM